jgi:hypothetical protein
MPKAFFRSVRSGKRKAALADLSSIARKEIEMVLDQRVKPALVKSHEKVVEDWTTKVTFQARKVLKPDSITIYVYPTGPNKKIWYYVDLGTDPHPITPKKPGGLLVFGWGGKGSYVPKTMAKPARTVSGGGYVKNPKVTYAKRVDHPGSEGRNFTGQIAEDIKPDFRREVENAFRRTARRCEE